MLGLTESLQTSVRTSNSHVTRG